MSFVWNYQMIKVEEFMGEESGILAEVTYDKDGLPDGFIAAHLVSIEEMELAWNDVKKQNGKLLTYFFDNGSFDKELNWVKN